MPDITQKKSTTICKIVWKDDRSATQEYLLKPAVTTCIGRDEGNNIVLSNPKVSKRHADIEWNGECYVLIDRGSSNGTTVNGKAIVTRTKLKNGDQIGIGDFVLSCQFIEDKPRLKFETRATAALKTVADEPVSELLTQLLPETDEKAAKMEAEAKKKDTPATLEPEATILLKSTGEAVLPTEVRPVEAGPTGEAAYQAKATENLGEILADLFKSISNAQSSANKLNEERLVLRNDLVASIDQLRQVSEELKILESEVEKARLGELLRKLSSSPNDVTLLMELSRYTTLIEKALKGMAQAAVIENAFGKLETDLKDYFG